jgi:hypothetical protein
VAGSFKFFPHFIVKDEVALRDKNIKYLSALVLANDQLCFLLLIIIIFNNGGFFFCLLFLVIEGRPI